MLYGWPIASQLVDPARPPLVTVFQRINYWRNTTRNPNLEWALARVPPTLTASISGDTATFAGTCSTDQIAGVRVGNTAWDVRCIVGDTPSTVAAALAASSGGTAIGPAITLAGLQDARTGRDAVTYRITRQQEVQFMVSVWTTDPDQRDTISAAIDTVLADTQYLPLPDGSVGRLTWIGTNPTDKAQNSDVWQRDIIYLVDFPTTRRSVRTPTLFYGVKYNPGPRHFGALWPVDAPPTYSLTLSARAVAQTKVSKTVAAARNAAVAASGGVSRAQGSVSAVPMSLAVSTAAEASVIKAVTTLRSAAVAVSSSVIERLSGEVLDSSGAALTDDANAPVIER